MQTWQILREGDVLGSYGLAFAVLKKLKGFTDL